MVVVVCGSCVVVVVVVCGSCVVVVVVSGCGGCCMWWWWWQLHVVHVVSIYIIQFV